MTVQKREQTCGNLSQALKRTPPRGLPTKIRKRPRIERVPFAASKPPKFAAWAVGRLRWVRGEMGSSQVIRETHFWCGAAADSPEFI